ncbi:MAG TPA: long-chain fatty acid--CoA ligase [Devosiaceae bacterium]|jgi:long-chain acyl-CoA synthetase|nr:long-chain fatty acid--CoA ligase [Devosiaceae bacterium]
MTVQGSDVIPRPWVDHYPSGIPWDIAVDTTPVHEQVLKSCARTPDAPALDFLGAVTTYGELGRSITAFAAALQRDFGVNKGTRVALMLPNTPFYVIAYYGVLLAGGTVVNCNPLYTVSELKHIVGNSGAKLMVSLDLKQVFGKAEALLGAGLLDNLVVCRFATALPFPKNLLFRIARRDDIARISQSPQRRKITFFGPLVRRGGRPEPVAIDPLTDVAVQQYTGGTTGKPKGAMLSHANIAANLAQIDAWALGLFKPPSKVVAVLPFFHIFSMTACMNLPLTQGAQTVMLPRFELKALLDLIGRTKANILLAVPTLLHALINAKQGSDNLKYLELAISGGAGLPGELLDAFKKRFPARLVEGYGLTEASPVVCCAAVEVEAKPNSIGQPLPATDLRFADLDDPTRVVPLGERGELLVKGPQVMLGYHGDEEATNAAFIDGYLRTGDVGYMDSDGYVFLVDRIKDLIICSGFNVYPRVIEDAFYLHEAVEEVSVIGVPDSYRGEAPVAFVKLRAGMAATPQELRDFAAERLNRLELPREIILKDQLPKTLIGKLSKKELREEYAARRAAAKAEAP